MDYKGGYECHEAIQTQYLWVRIVVDPCQAIPQATAALHNGRKRLTHQATAAPQERLKGVVSCLAEREVRLTLEHRWRLPKSWKCHTDMIEMAERIAFAVAGGKLAAYFHVLLGRTGPSFTEPE